MGHELVSVVIPTFNYRRYVTAAVESVLAQTYRNFEIIVVDDGSTDRTDEALAPYAAQIRYIYQHNQGLSAARNTGIMAARGRWIALLDSDDLWHSEKLAMQMGYLAQHPEVGLLASERITEMNNGWPSVDPRQPTVACSIKRRQLAVRSLFGPSGVLIRRECFDQVGLFDPQLQACEDRDMWMRIAVKFRIAKLLQPLWWYRSHPHNMTLAADRMEEYEFRMLTKRFATNASPGTPARLQRKAFGLAFYESAIRYAQAGMNWRSLNKLARSLLAWPFPFQVGEVRRPLERGRMFLVVLLRLLHFKPAAKSEAHTEPADPPGVAGTNNS